MRVTVSRAKDIGGRPYQEDNLLAQKFAHDRFIIAAVMDGHAGSQCSAFLHQQIMKAICTCILGNPNQPISKDQLKTALESMHSRWETSKDFDGSGATLSGILIDKLRPSDIWFYNLGDSQAVMFDKDGDIKHKTVLHDLSDDHQARIKAKYPSAHISNSIFDVKRVHGRHSALNLSGAFGDAMDPILKKCLIKDVDVDKVSIDGTRSFAQRFPLTIVLGSDGLWDELTHAEVRNIILDFYERFQKSPSALQRKSLSTPADDLLCAVKRKGLKKDNVSIVVMILEQDRKRSKLELTAPAAAMLPLLPPL